MKILWKLHTDLLKILGKWTTAARNNLKWQLFLNFGVPTSRYRSLMKIKTIDHATIKDTLTISIKYSIICAPSCPKFWENRCLIFISLSTPRFQPRSCRKIKTNWPATANEIFNHFLKFWCKPHPDVRKNLRKVTRIDKNTYKQMY